MYWAAKSIPTLDEIEEAVAHFVPVHLSIEWDGSKRGVDMLGCVPFRPNTLRQCLQAMDERRAIYHQRVQAAANARRRRIQKVLNSRKVRHARQVSFRTWWRRRAKPLRQQKPEIDYVSYPMDMLEAFQIALDAWVKERGIDA